MLNFLKISSASFIGVVFALILSQQAFAEPEITGDVRTSFGQYGSSKTVGEGTSESGSSFAGSLRGRLWLNGQFEEISYALTLQGEGKYGGTPYGVTYKNDNGFIVKGEVSIGLVSNLTLALGNYIDVGSKNLTDISPGASPIGIAYPGYLLLDGAGLVLRFDNGTYQAGFGLSGNSKPELTPPDPADEDDDGSGNVAQQLIYANARFFDGKILAGFRQLGSTTTATRTVNDNEITDKTSESIQVIEARYANDGLYLGLEMGNTGGSKTLVSNTLKDDTPDSSINLDKKSILALAGSFAVGSDLINVLYSSTGTETGKTTLAAGATAGSESETVTILEYRITPSTYLIYGAKNLTDNLDNDTGAELGTAKIEEAQSYYLGVVLRNTL